MVDTHIHIHLNGEALPVEAKAAKKTSKRVSKASPAPKATKRKPSAYNRRYAAALKKIQHKHKTKAGSWKKDGYKKAVKEAHRLAKK